MIEETKNIFCLVNKQFEPVKGTPNSLGYDIKASINITINPGTITLIPTGVKTNFASFLYPRSSLPLKKGLMMANSVGVIDADYRGEILVQLINVSRNPVVIQAGERIAQIIPYDKDIQIKTIVDPKLYDNFQSELATERGDGGFGSTGK